MLAMLGADEIMANKLVPFLCLVDGDAGDGCGAAISENRQVDGNCWWRFAWTHRYFFTVILISTCAMHFSLALYFSLPLRFSSLTATNRQQNTDQLYSVCDYDLTILQNVCSLDSILAPFLRLYLLILGVYDAVLLYNKRGRKY